MAKKIKEELDQYDYVDDEYIEKVRPAYIKAIGQFVLQFSSLEHQLNIEIAEKINPRAHVPGYQVIELLSTKDKINLFSRLVYSWIAGADPKQKAQAADIISKFKGFNTFRNKILHANWMSVNKDGTVRTSIGVDKDGSVQFERTKLTPEIINKISIEISKFLPELENFVDNI